MVTIYANISYTIKSFIKYIEKTCGKFKYRQLMNQYNIHKKADTNKMSSQLLIL